MTPLAATIEQRAREAIERAVSHRPRDLRRHLMTLGINPDLSRSEIIGRLKNGLTAQKRAAMPAEGRTGPHYTYDSNRVIALRQALAAIQDGEVV